MRPVIRGTAALATVALSAAAVGCGEGHNERAAKKAVAHFYDALKRHDSKAVCGSVTAPVAAEMLRPSGQARADCVRGMERLFSIVAKGPIPGFFDRSPSIGDAHVEGDEATVEVTANGQQRAVGLTRVGSRWVLSRSPGFDQSASRTQPAARLNRIGRAGCSTGTVSVAQVRASRDVVIGPLVLVGGRRWAGVTPDAFDRHGYKVPATLPAGERARLFLPKSMRGHVGLVFSSAAQSRVKRLGVRGADTAVHFSACAESDKPARTGWPGGLVVDHPRCVTLAVKTASGRMLRQRVPLGRRC